jgi:hypothetical protein
VADDWRLTVTLDPEGAKRLLTQLREHEAEAESRNRLGGAVAVSGQGNNVYAYADSREAIHETATVVQSLLGEQAVETSIVIHRWHELEQRWEDEAVPLPQTETEREAELRRLEEAESEESLESGRALWEVRLELRSHGRTRELADRLEQEGFQVIRRWTFLLVGAESEDDASELADRLRNEARDAEIQVEPSGEMIAEVSPRNPFAMFGGLAG